MTDRRADASEAGDHADLQRFLDALCDGGCIADRTATIARISELAGRPGVGEALRKRAMDAMGKLARRFEHEPACVNGLSVMKTRVGGDR